MNFGKADQLILAIGIFVVAGIFLNQMHAKQKEETEQLNTQLAAAQLLVPKLIADKEDLDGQLAQMQADLSDAQLVLDENKAKFPNDAESIEYDELIFEIAHDRDLDIDTLAASEAAQYSVDNVEFNVTSFTITLKGNAEGESFTSAQEYRAFTYQTVMDILDFISAVAEGPDFSTTTIESVDIDLPEPLTDDDILEMEGEEGGGYYDTASATIRVDVYSYEES